MKKIYRFKGLNIGVSYWGRAEFQGRQMLQLLEEFDSKQVSGNGNVDSISEKLKEYFESQKPKIWRRMGLRVAGYY